VSRAPITSRARTAEDEVRRADRDAIAIAQHFPRDTPPIQLRAVRRAQIDDEVGVALPHDLGVTARGVAVGDPEVAFPRAADDGTLRGDRVRAAVDGQCDELAGRLGRCVVAGFVGLPTRPVDHRRSRSSNGNRGHRGDGGRCDRRRHRGDRDAARGRRRGRCGQGGNAVLRLCDPCRDPELPHREVVVDRKPNPGRRQEGVGLAPRVLGQVLLQLADQRPLVGGELLPVGARQVDRVLVRHVHAGDRDGAVLVHLLRKLAGELDGLDVGSEGAAEDALEEALDLAFDGTQDAHCGSGRLAAKGSGRC
jgi:hypothetical protein